MWMTEFETRAETYHPKSENTYPKDMMGANHPTVMSEETTRELRHVIRDGLDYDESKWPFRVCVCVCVFV